MKWAARRSSGLWKVWGWRVWRGRPPPKWKKSLIAAFA
jgi:hypothetical protein